MFATHGIVHRISIIFLRFNKAHTQARSFVRCMHQLIASLWIFEERKWTNKTNGATLIVDCWYQQRDRHLRGSDVTYGLCTMRLFIALHIPKGTPFFVPFSAISINKYVLTHLNMCSRTWDLRSNDRKCVTLNSVWYCNCFPICSCRY